MTYQTKRWGVRKIGVWWWVVAPDGLHRTWHRSWASAYMRAQECADWAHMCATERVA